MLTASEVFSLEVSASERGRGNAEGADVKNRESDAGVPESNWGSDKGRDGIDRG